MSEVKLNLPAKDGVTTLLQGQAAVIIEPKKYDFQGDIRSVANWLLTKKQDTDLIKSVLLINYENGAMKLCMNFDQENGRITSTVTAKLSKFKDLEAFRINTAYGWDTTDLGNHFKFNRRYFIDKSINMDIVSGLKSFRANVTRDLEKASDDRGNHRRLDDKRVTTNLPEVFTLIIPLFDEQPPVSIDVELVIEEKEGITRVKLQSVDLIEKMQQAIRTAIDEQLERIKSIENLTLIYE